MSLDEPGLDTSPVTSDVRERELRQAAQEATVVRTDGGAPSRTPDELIALAEQEQADRRVLEAQAAAELARADAEPLDLTGRGADRPAPPRRARTRRARKVRRIIRRVDAWSILKVSVLFFSCVYLILMVAGVLLWNAAQQAGTIEGFEGFIADLGAYQTFTFQGGQIFNAALLGGLVLVIAGSAGNVLLAVLFNLISDLTGGVRVTVIEEEQVPQPGDRRSTRARPAGQHRRPNPGSR